MPLHDIQERGEQIVALRKLWPEKAPLRMPMQLFPAFVCLVDRLKERCRVGHMNQDRKSELAARLPNAVPPWIVDLDQRAVRILIFQAKLLKNLHAGRA